MFKNFGRTKFSLVELCLVLLGMVLWPEMELLVPSLPSMMDYFFVTKGQIQQVLSANFLGFIFGVILAGPLCDSIGRRKTTIIGMAVFLIASVWVSMASNLEVMMIARFVQGFSVTGPIIGGSTMLLERTQGHAQIFWMSISSASITFAMASAPLLGALINEYHGFRGNLWTIVIFGLVGFFPFLCLAKETVPKEKLIKFRPRSIIHNYGLILKSRQFMCLAVAVSAMPAGYWIYTGVSSLYLINYLGLSECFFGVYQAPITATFAVLSLSISFLNKKTGKKLLLKIGFLLMLVGSTGLLMMSILDKESALATTIFMMFFVGGMTPANSLLFPDAISKLPTELQGSGQAMIQALRLLFASLGTGSLGFLYKGSFLPVAIILLLLFLISSFLIYIERKNLDKKSDNLAFAVGH